MSASDRKGELRLGNESRVAVVGGGPAGSFFSYFLLEMASRAAIRLNVDIYEPKALDQTGPAACNMCGGIVSESLVQILATEGIKLPSNVVQRGIDSYVLHTDAGSVRIEPPGLEKRIAAIHRGGGPRGLLQKRWQGLDAYLLGLAAARGARILHERVESIAWLDGKPRIKTKTVESDAYDLLAAAVGVNGHGIRLFEGLDQGYSPPKTARTFICELPLGQDAIESFLGNSMHVFLLNLPRLEFAAMIPKGDYATVVLLGDNVDKQLVAWFLNAPEVKRLFPPGWNLPQDYCRCFPSINVRGASRPFGDRLVFVGDCGESRLYKDGIGGAYRTAKAAATTAIFSGISAEDFRRHYLPVCRDLSRDNNIGKLIFGATGFVQAFAFARRGILRTVAAEQRNTRTRHMSSILWDTFTGSAPYRNILHRMLHPLFLMRLSYGMATSCLPGKGATLFGEIRVNSGDLGRVFHPGETIIRQGEVGDCMYVIQEGQVEVIRESDGGQIRLAQLGMGEIFGEMALLEQDVRSATVRALGEVRVLTVDRKILLRKLHEDPSLAFRIIHKLSGRVRRLNRELAERRTSLNGY